MATFKEIGATDIKTSRSVLNQLVDVIQEDISVNTPDENKRTPLMAAAFQGSFELTKFLLKKGADVNAQDFAGKTALMVAAAQGNIKIVKLLLREQGRLDFRDRYSRTAWMHAAEHQRLSMVRFLSSKEINNEEKYDHQNKNKFLQ